jgi:hypothetical protein
LRVSCENYTPNTHDLQLMMKTVEACIACPVCAIIKSPIITSVPDHGVEQGRAIDCLPEL